MTRWRLSRRGKVDRIRRRSAEHGYRILIYGQRGLAIEWCRLNGIVRNGKEGDKSNERV